MRFENLKDCHIEAAAQLAVAEYFEERSTVPLLPDGEYYDRFCNLIVDLIDHNLGIVAIEDGRLIGFLTCCQPWENHFGTTMGTFSPIHAHGAIKRDRQRVYSLLYQNAAEKWVKAGVLSHAIALYAHDTETIDGFFRNGFGLRCVDAIRDAAPFPCDEYPEYTFGELPLGEIAQIVPFKNLLNDHLRQTPMFIPLAPDWDIASVKAENEKRQSRCFVAEYHDKVIAFIEITAAGENFAWDDPRMINICGAFMMPEHRGKGVCAKLLAVLLETIRLDGYTRCGVDFESFNPTANRFWLKHFTAYTYSVARRIDERI